ncbi:MarR family transcriptional regulator [Rathayibacter rathayi]|uniref:MarR family transcriptional regulator n=3 Tax=Rathayibacter rathayi TaxID=33887 RepID=A0ABX5AD25_RATRA|nr:MarR family transcriptional regulator [Rathayibacter rathayi]PPF48229.1 MarR family transcriptional regulator [Rathayibacter rathayi]PPG42400.1 MarR family transcriptional regulator [Rathayibacter rathayi]PPG68347.1 MarR family transcriptional regulator [Rathayibacter rathayi]PPG76306.1 MarR family transcriptional regulator [Rathayibacter rathayi]
MALLVRTPETGGLWLREAYDSAARGRKSMRRPLVRDAGGMTGPSPDSARTVDSAIASVEGELSTLFNRVRASMRSCAERLHPELTSMGYKTLSALERRGPVHSGVLAELLEMDKSALSRQITALDRLGLLERTPDPRDGRATILSVTPATAERLRETRSSKQALMHEELRTWELSDIELFASLLHRINDLDT